MKKKGDAHTSNARITPDLAFFGRQLVLINDVEDLGQDRITIIGPRSDDGYVVEFRTGPGETLAISFPRREVAVTKFFQARMPNG